MSAIGRNPRSQRARPILVQGGLPGEVIEQLSEDLQPTGARVVNTIFDAVCDAGQALVGAPVSAVLMGPPPGSIAERQVVEAFRRTDPSVRLVRLVTASDSNDVESVMSAGFDDAVKVPASANRLAQALGGPMTPNPTPAHEPREEHETESTAPAHGTHQSTPGPLPSIVEVVLENAMTRISKEHPTGTPPIEGKLMATYDDADLVRAVLEGGNIEGIAIEMIRRQTGLSSVQFRLIDPADTNANQADAQGAQLEIPVAEGILGFLTSADQADEQLLEPWSRWLSSWLLLQNEHARLQRMALTDHLTGAGNRHALFRVLDLVIERARQERRAVTVMCFDIDNFKTYNDRFGHDAGDQVLRETVQLLNSVIRRGDHVFRMGGDEFVVVFADPSGPRSARSSPPESIEQIAERFQQQVGKLQLPQIGLDAPGTLSISAGMVTYPWDGATSEELLRRADQLALESKRSGKNVITFGPAARNLHGR
jgi:diguanylate cyclase (GGDEF)-like protein